MRLKRSPHFWKVEYEQSYRDRKRCPGCPERAGCPGCLSGMGGASRMRCRPAKEVGPLFDGRIGVGDRVVSVWTIVLPYPRPPDGLSANSRTHWRVKARATAEVRNLVVALTRSHRVPKMQRCEVQIVWVVTDRRKRDTDGPDPFCKAIYDAIGSDRGISAHIVPDDSPEWMSKPRLRIEYRPGEKARFEVTIRDISHRPDDIDAIARTIQ
ncbi:hypothetical protein AOA12_20155 [Microbacterium sp. No. 7]|nr:hypothetical protein AOA12_20155 [Microbacterium sp. No. 7]